VAPERGHIVPSGSQQQRDLKMYIAVHSGAAMLLKGFEGRSMCLESLTRLHLNPLRQGQSDAITSMQRLCRPPTSQMIWLASSVQVAEKS
jgi:hypothetical protein